MKRELEVVLMLSCCFLSQGDKGGRMLGFWVSLGDGFGRIWRTGRGSEGRRKLLISEGRRRRILLALTLSLVLSSIGKKVNEERRRC